MGFGGWSWLSTASYLLTVGEDFTVFFVATLATLRVWLPLAGLKVHVECLKAAKDGDLRLGHRGARPVHLGHGQSLESKDGETRVSHKLTYQTV